MGNKQNLAVFALVCVGLLLLSSNVSLRRSYINNRARITRGEILFGKIRSQFHRKCMDIDYQLLAESETQNNHAKAVQFLNWHLNNLIWKFISVVSAVILLIMACIALTTVNPLLIEAIIIGMILNTVISIMFISVNNEINEKRIVNDRYIDYYNDVSLEHVAAKDIRIFGMEGEIKRKSCTTQMNILTVS